MENHMWKTYTSPKKAGLGFCVCLFQKWFSDAKKVDFLESKQNVDTMSRISQGLDLFFRKLVFVLIY